MSQDEIPNANSITETPILPETSVPAEDDIGNTEPHTPKAHSVKDYKSTVTISDPCFAPSDVDFTKVPMLSFPYSTLNGMLSSLDPYDHVKEQHFSLEWKIALQQSSLSGILEDGLEDAMRREADWGQHVEVEGVKLRAAKPRIARSSNSGSKLIGQQAISKITALTSAGITVMIPLWHSGIWVSLKAPPLSAWIELERRIALEKTVAGRSTRGLVFSNDSVYMISHIVDFALQYVFDCNLQNWSPELLRKLIKVPDISFLANGLALTIFPDGHPFSQPCVSNISDCQHVSKGIVQLSKLMWVDRSKLTEQQRKHMLKRDQARQPSEIEAYQDQWFETKSQVVKINDNLSVVFKMPSLEDQIEMGTTWITQIEQATEEAFGTKLRGEQREAYLQEQTQATRIGFYVHWIEKFIVEEDGEQQTVDDRTTIEETCMALSGSLEVSEAIIKGAKAFINERIISVIGIPNYQCPSCGNWHLTEDSPSKAIIPIDAVSNFFTLQQSLITTKLRIEA